MTYLEKKIAADPTRYEGYVRMDTPETNDRVIRKMFDRWTAKARDSRQGREIATRWDDLTLSFNIWLRDTYYSLSLRLKRLGWKIENALDKWAGVNGKHGS